MWNYAYTDELYHYGVKGMKWGVRRYQNKDGTLTAAGKTHYATRNSPSKKEAHNAQRFVQSMRGRRLSQMSGGDFDVLAVQALTYIAFVAAFASAAKVSEKRHRAKKAAELEELNRNKSIKSFKECPKMETKMTPSESAKHTNPEFPTMGTTMNCTFCTTAMALRERGYDVKAAKLNDGWYPDDLFKAAFNSPQIKMKPKKNATAVLKELSAQGDGAYGNLSVAWKIGGRHSIFWKNENGTTNIYDGQSGKAYTSFNDKKVLFANTNLSNICYNRLDNCEPTEYALAIVERRENKQ